MKRWVFAATVFVACALQAGVAMAWGAQGHQYVGSLGSSLLNDKAAAQVRSLLGPNVDLAHAAVWPDCIRDVSGSLQNGFHWSRSPYSPDACLLFGNDATEKAAMEDYARRNWTNCEYAGHRTKCNLAFHFADVAIQHDHYERSYFGTGPADVVSALKAAILVLEGQPAPAPFQIKDKREALFLLAHFMGDVHQPLHVGAIYLDDHGQPLDPDATPGDHLATETTGGNWLFHGSSNLHHDWDTISVATTPSQAAVCEAAKVHATAGAVVDRPVLWASESVLAARTKAFPHLTFTSAGPRHWDISFEDRAAYVKQMHALQQHQLISAGARLAEVLNTIWPGQAARPHCP